MDYMSEERDELKFLIKGEALIKLYKVKEQLYVHELRLIT